jgi:RimJ/RimL family protein N-acetyltransferase
MADTPDPWPLWQLELRTPRLTLRPDDDAGLAELMAEACRGVHAPDEMPFVVPWTTAEPDQLVRNGLQFHWSTRAALRPNDWTVNFLIRHEGKVIGTQGLSGKDFAITREVSSGSWLGLPFQGKGLGTEMRAAVLMFAFDHLGAHTARSAAFEDNPSSLAVSRKLGYQPDGTEVCDRQGTAAVSVRQLVTAERFAKHRPDWKLEVSGVAAALPMLGL